MKKENDSLRLIVSDNIKDFGGLVDKNLRLIRKANYSYIAPTNFPRFSNSEGRADLLESVRGKDVYILSDVSNYSCTYNMYGEEHHMSYDEHFQDIKRAISASIGTTNKLYVVMPLLYQSRQHKREHRQSLDCAMALKELEFHGVNGVITFDAHDPSVGASVFGSRTNFTNLYPTNDLLHEFLDTEDIDFSKLVVINPDEGAVKRAKYFSSLLYSETAGFRKVRDLQNVTNGKSEILSHQYDGSVSIEGKNVIIVDDMISSGGSILRCAEEMKNYKANKIYLFTTFALFSDGKKSINKFNEAYEKGLFDKIYTTNLTYIPDEVKNSDWLIEVDCSMQLAKVINAQNKNNSISPYLNGSDEIKQKVLTKIKKD